MAPADRRAGPDLLSWPDPVDWLAACAGSPLVAVGPDAHPDRPLRLVGELLYLDRYWRQEELVRRQLDERAGRTGAPVDLPALRSGLARLFGDPAPDRQRLAAATAAVRSLTVLAGGPGTGKTTTVAKLLELLLAQPGPAPRIALAAPTGKAAARLQQAVDDAVAAGRLPPAGLAASTLHRLLGRRPGSTSRFRHDRDNRLPYDVVVVDETSMVSLTLMARLLDALRPDTRLVLVGDPDQLASVEAGAVLGDLVARPPAGSAVPPPELAELVAADLPEPVGPAADELRNGVVRLTTPHRFGREIGALAAAVQDADPERVLAILRAGGPAVSFVDVAEGSPLREEHLDGLRADVVDAARELGTAAHAGDAGTALAGLERHRLLCAHRRGSHGVARWSAEVERWVAAAVDPAGGGSNRQGEWYVGRPLLVTANDYEVGVFNGDTGVVVDGAGRGPLVAFARGGRPWLLSPHRLSAVQTVHAMTVHRAQGSQFGRVTLLLPPAESRVLTRELLYTAVTRAQRHVRVVGSAEAVRAAVLRPVVRASGLRRGRNG